jgi:hypothetical protein
MLREISLEKKDDIKAAAIEVLSNELARRSPRSWAEEGSLGRHGRHILLILNVMNNAEERWEDLVNKQGINKEAAAEYIIPRAAKEGLRVAFEDQDERFDWFSRKMKGAATLLAENRELAIAAGRAYVALRIAYMKEHAPDAALSPQDQEKADSYEKALKEIEELADEKKDTLKEALKNVEDKRAALLGITRRDETSTFFKSKGPNPK